MNASKVGERQRTAHWLANASRVYCRLGDGDKAAKLAKIAERILKGAIDERYSPQYKEAIMAEVYISQGEKALLIDQKTIGGVGVLWAVSPRSSIPEFCQTTGR